jgi:hypothetical protein
VADGEAGDEKDRKAGEVAGPVFPLTRDQFADALAKGLGRARVQVEHHGVAGLEDLVLDACLHNRAYDPQCESERAGWVFDLAAAAGLAEHVLVPLVEKLRTDTEAEFWDASHRCGLAARLADCGYSEARSALYAAFRKNPDSADLIGAQEIIILDGPDGLLFVAQALGRMLTSDPELCVDDTPVIWFDHSHGVGRGRTILESAAATDKLVRVYLEYLERAAAADAAEKIERRPEQGLYSLDTFAARSEQKPAKPPRAITSLNEVIAFIEHPAARQDRPLLRRYGRAATEDDLRVISEHLEACTEPAKIRMYLEVFARRRYSPLLAKLLALVEHPDALVRRAAMRALSEHAHPDVQALVWQRIVAKRASEGEVRLLRHNYRPGDHERIEQLLREPFDPDTMHWLAMDVLDVFEGNCLSAGTDCLLLVYERTPCSSCRGSTVRWLVKQKTAPAWLLAECRFDVDSGTVALCVDAPAGGR